MLIKISVLPVRSRLPQAFQAFENIYHCLCQSATREMNMVYRNLILGSIGFLNFGGYDLCTYVCGLVFCRELENRPFPNMKKNQRFFSIAV